MNDYVYIGKIVNTHGIKGEFRILSDFELKDKVFMINNHIYLGEDKKEYEILSYRHHKEYEMITVNGITDINEALRLKGLKVYFKRSDLNINTDEYLLEDLINCEVLEDDKTLGKITDIIYNNSNILLKVTGLKDFYIPYQGDFISKVDKENKKVYTSNAKDLII